MPILDTEDSEVSLSPTIFPSGCSASVPFTPVSGSSCRGNGENPESARDTPVTKTAQDTVELSDEEKRQVAELARRDREVRAHEAAHMAAGGGYVRGGASFSYQSGPDGKRYAVGGEVSIDTSPVKGNPAATVRKMQAVRSAALAPANPSGQDRSVAAAAAAAEAAARQELNREQSSSGSGTGAEAGKNGRYDAKARLRPEPQRYGGFETEA